MDKNGKNKKPVTRAFSAGGVVYREIPTGYEWLLIKPKGGVHWRLPKGTIEQGENAETAAAREVFEETGIRAKIVDRIGYEKYFFQLKGERIFKTNTFFLMSYLGGSVGVDKKWAHEVESVGWFGIDDAQNKLHFKGEKEILGKAIHLVDYKK